MLGARRRNAGTEAFIIILPALDPSHKVQPKKAQPLVPLTHHPLYESMSIIQGQLLEVTVVGCSKLKDTEWISRQDPYVCLEYATNKFTDGGRNPCFQEKTTIPLVEGLREISVSVWNSNTITFDDFIGSARVQLQRVLSEGYDDSSWSLQTKSGSYAGEVKLIMHYTNAGKAQQKPSFSAGCPTSYAAQSMAAPSYPPRIGAYPAATPYSMAYPPPLYQPPANPAPYQPPPAAYPPPTMQPPPYPPTQPCPPATYPPPPQAPSCYPSPGPYPAIYPPPY